MVQFNQPKGILMMSLEKRTTETSHQETKSKEFKVRDPSRAERMMYRTLKLEPVETVLRMKEVLRKILMM